MKADNPPFFKKKRIHVFTETDETLKHKTDNACIK